MLDGAPQATGTRLKIIASVWWPLALSWLLMGVEQPIISAVVARLPHARENLAAYGGVVFPIALVIEAPVIMLLAASTELSRDRASYEALGRFTHRLGATMTILHALFCATPLFDFVVGDLLAVPQAAHSAARLGLWCMLPWTWSIASRRFHQGALIRFGHARAVTTGTMLRLGTGVSTLAIGWSLGVASGVVVGALALSAGVLAEAIYAAWRVRVLVRGPLRDATASVEPLRGAAFLRFYVPLAMTPLVTLVTLPIGTAALSRMPDPMASLAVWPMVSSLLFALQTVGLAFNEVVVAKLDDPTMRTALRRFTLYLAGATTAIFACLSIPFVARGWFSTVAGLPPDLTVLAASVLWIGLPIPAMRALQSWYQGQLVVARRTRGISEAVIVFALTDAAILVTGVAFPWASGLAIALTGFACARTLQTAWLAWRAGNIAAPSRKTATRT